MTNFEVGPEVAARRMAEAIFRDAATPDGSLGVDELASMMEEHLRGLGSGQQSPSHAEQLAQAVDEMASWWAGVAAQDAERTVPKALQYGAHDLDVMAWAMDPMLLPVEGETREARHKRGLEAAVWFYALGKIARIQAAILAGADSSDHWFDTGVYSMMARRIRETGRWP